MFKIFCENCWGRGYINVPQLVERMDSCEFCSGDGYIEKSLEELMEEEMEVVKRDL